MNWIDEQKITELSEELKQLNKNLSEAKDVKVEVQALTQEINTMNSHLEDIEDGIGVIAFALVVIAITMLLPRAAKWFDF